MQRRVMTPRGEISFELEYKRVKNINLRIVRGGEVKVSAPRAARVGLIDSFVISKADFIFRALDRVAPSVPCRSYEDGEQVSVLGELYTLRVVEASRGGAVIRDGNIILSVKSGADREVRRALVVKLREAALLRLVPTLLERAMPYFTARGIAKPRISYRAMRSRWGSCHTKKGRITLSKALAECSVACVEYVLAHELTHLIHPNHSPAFYAELAKIMPDWRTRRERLRAFRTE